MPIEPQTSPALTADGAMLFLETASAITTLNNHLPLLPAGQLSESHKRGLLNSLDRLAAEIRLAKIRLS